VGLFEFFHSALALTCESGYAYATLTLCRGIDTRGGIKEGLLASTSMATPDQHPILEASALWKRCSGPALLILGWASIMIHWFWWGVAIAYVGWLACFAEWSVDTYVIRKPIQLQLVGFACLMFIFDLFTISTVLAKAPLDLMGYVSGGHAAGELIGGISWDEHFTDLRMALTNPTDNDYQTLDINLRPNVWLSQGVILDKPSFCELSRAIPPEGIMGQSVVVTKARTSGEVKVTGRLVGNGVDVSDDAGNIYTVLAADTGYRLICSVLPAQFTIRLVLAAVARPTDLNVPARMTRGVIMNVWDSSYANPFNIFSARPVDTTLEVDGHYQSGMKPFSIRSTLRIER
jgi:hypothetical protein